MLDPEALNSTTMEKVLETLRMVKNYTDKGAPGRDWNLATAMVIKGEAGMQFMGDWAKGEFIAAGKMPGKDYVCGCPPRAPPRHFTFNIDSFIMFKLKNAENEKAQKAMAAPIMQPEFQEVFNLNKGSIPVRMGMDPKQVRHPGPALDEGFRGQRQERRPGARAWPTRWR